MKIKLLKYLFIASCILLFVNQSNGQQLDLNFLNISSKDGLSSNLVNAIHKDKYGFMWFGTDDGLNKFDGERFTVYRHKAEDAESISSNEILYLFEDGRDNLWICTGSGLVMYDRDTDAFKNIASTKDFTTTSVCVFNNKVWLAHYSGLVILDQESGEISEVPLKSKEDKSVLARGVLHLFKDSKNRLWIGTNAGLYIYNVKQQALEKFLHNSSDPQSIASNYISQITEDLNGNIWVATEAGLSMLVKNTRKFINYRNNPNDINSLSNNIVYTIASAPDGKLWVGTEDGLNIVNPATKKVERAAKNSRNKYGLVGKSVKEIYLDNQGIFWIATFRGGINKYDKNLAFFNLRQSNHFDPFGLSAPVVTSFAKQTKNTIYIGTDGGGLNLYQTDNGSFKHIPVANNPKEDKNLSILTMENDGNNLWIGTYLHGVFILNTQTGQRKQIKAGNNPQSISDNNIFCLKRDSKGNMWIGTNGQGVDCYNVQKKEFFNYSSKETGKYKLPINGFIRAIAEDKEGNIWIGSNGTGIAVYNPIRGTSKLISKTNTKLPNDNIYAIYISMNGKVWIGSAGGGLTHYDVETGNITSFSEEQGLANGVVYKIIEDAYGKIWLSTNKGISSFDTFTKKFKNYSYNNGVQRSPFVTGAGLKLDDGKIFFGGTDGFNYFDPKFISSNKNQQKVILTDLKINNLSVRPGENSPIEHHISVADEINLDFKQNFLLSFVALNYSSPQENRYSYKLENFDKEWNYIGQSQTAIYTNLDPGTYIFKVKASSDAGDWTTPITEIKIVVNPPFWRTIYAFILYLFIIVSVLLYIRHRGIQKLKSKFALEQERIQIQSLIEQERLESERIHEFDEMKIKFLTNISHEFRTPISLIIGPIAQLIQQETNSAKYQQLNMVKRNARRLLNLVNQLLDFRNISTNENKLNPSEGDFISFCKEVADSFKDLAEQKGINFDFQSTIGSYYTAFDLNKIERIFFNLLSNAFKFTLEGGEILFKIELGNRKEGLKITIVDTGIGIDENAKEKIFERFFQNQSNPAILNQGSGIGLSIAKEFVKMHGGTIEVESIKGEGSTFIIYFPFEKIKEIESAKSKIESNLEQNVFNDDNEFEIVAEENYQNEIKPVILIVDDNEDFRHYLKDNLKEYYTIIEAENGKDGWQKVLSSHPQLVVSDVNMPQVTGIELCRKIKLDKRTKHIPVILLTAITGEESQMLGLETGANDYLNKPFNFEILQFKIRNLLTMKEHLKNTYSKQMNVTVKEIEVESENEKLMNKALNFIESNLTNPQLSVEELSNYIGMSRGSLYTKVLEMTGETPVEFIRSIKLKKAANLLEKSDLNVAQICYAVGFSTPNYFARAFKAKYNMLPSEFINLKRNKNNS